MKDADGGKYDLKPFKYSSHYWILNCLKEFERPLDILDVGTADGYLGALLKEQGHNLVGVETNPLSVDKAKIHYKRIFQADIESFDFPFDQEFDCIIFADVLEHLRDPETVLKRAMSALRPTGQVVISVPNVANIVVRLSLLFGRFNYAERGILDRTHLRFFTLATLQRMVNNCALRVTRMLVTPIPVQLVMPLTHNQVFSPLHEVHYWLVSIWKTLGAYQFVICVQR